MMVVAGYMLVRIQIAVSVLQSTVATPHYSLIVALPVQSVIKARNYCLAAKFVAKGQYFEIFLTQ
jgi:hypothetical protein